VLELIVGNVELGRGESTPATRRHTAWKRDDFKELYAERILAAYLVIGPRQHTIVSTVLRATDSLARVSQQ
jgi:hypothetical protein